MTNKQKGFTLIELLVVIAVLGLLASLVLISTNTIKSKSRDARRAADIKSIQEGLALYQDSHQVYPIYDGYITGTDAMSTALENDKLIQGVPVDPLNREMNGILYKYYYQSTQGGIYLIQYYLETDSVQGRTQGLNQVVP